MVMTVLSIEQKEFDIFCLKLSQGEFKHQRVGQAFYNHFKLHKLADQDVLQNLYELDGERALNTIKSICTFH